MRLLFFLLLFFLRPVSGLCRVEQYTGSTPAGNEVRQFLGISIRDSIDFIRWNLSLSGSTFRLSAEFGIGKPNTNGFYGGGTTRSVAGKLNREKQFILLHSGNNSLRLAVINNNLLHFIGNDRHLLLGNAGWSYTLNNLRPGSSRELSFASTKMPEADSITFLGRSPCGVPGIVPAGKTCYKIKWKVVLFSAGGGHQRGTFHIDGSAWRTTAGPRGNWSIVNVPHGRKIYRLRASNSTTIINLLPLDDSIVLFTDAQGRPLTGDLDFSYTLNRSF